jgi:hypothetical protein
VVGEEGGGHLPVGEVSVWFVELDWWCEVVAIEVDEVDIRVPEVLVGI